jgi:uncharacterized protein involved in exopolysaccharide biosynthesis
MGERAQLGRAQESSAALGRAQEMGERASPHLRYGPDPDAIPILALLNMILRRRATVFWTIFLTLAVVVAVTLFRQRTYTSTVSFLTQASKTNSAAAGLASQFGLSLPTAQGSESPQFYADLVTSREILTRIANATYVVQTPGGGRRGNLLYFYDVAASNPALAREKIVKQLRSRIQTLQSDRTGVITLSIQAPYPTLAVDIASRLLDELNRFNVERRKSQATAEKTFVENRMAQANSELLAAESRLQDFLTQNREYARSPRLAFDQDRLAREVSMRQQIYTSLAQAYEQAKIDEVRDSPVLTVVEPPVPAALPDSRGVLKRSLLAVVVGLLLGILIAGIKEYIGRSDPSSSDQAAEFAALRAAAVDDLIHPWRPLQRKFRSRASA